MVELNKRTIEQDTWTKKRKKNASNILNDDETNWKRNSQ